MRLTEIVSLIENEVNIFGNNLYWATFLTSCREERVGYAQYDELRREVSLDFSVNTRRELPLDFFYYIAPVVVSNTRDLYFLASDISFFTKDFHGRGTQGKIISEANNRSYAYVDKPIQEPVKLLFYSKHLFRFPLWEAGRMVTNNSFIFHDYRYYKAIGTGNLGTLPPTHTSGTQVNGDVSLEYLNFVFEALPPNTTLDQILPQVEMLYPPDVIFWSMLYRVKKMRNLDFSTEFENLENARRLYGSRNQALVNVKIGSG